MDESAHALPCLVTGGSGFLGRAVTEILLERGCPEVRVLDLVAPPPHPRVRHLPGDIRTADVNAACKGVGVVYHLAACQYHSPLARSTFELPFHSVNVEGTLRVVRAAACANARRFVFVSTNMVYGPASYLPITESHPKSPFGPYGQSKLVAEGIVDGARDWGLETAIVRPGLLVGPGRTGVFRHVFEWILASKPIYWIGSGCNRYEMIAVNDCARLVVHAGSHRGGGVYNASARDVPPMREWLSALVAETGSRSRFVQLPGRATKMGLSLLERVHLAPLRSDQYMIADQDYYLDSTSARLSLGYEPAVGGVNAVLQTLEWYLTARPGTAA